MNIRNTNYAHKVKSWAFTMKQLQENSHLAMIYMSTFDGLLRSVSQNTVRMFENQDKRVHEAGQSINYSQSYKRT